MRMNYQISFERRADYIYAMVTGTNSRENVLAYMDDVLSECQKSDCFKVLVDERLDGPRLGEMEIFDLASEGSMKALGQFESLAYVDQQMGDMMEFAETVAINRGMPVAMFNNVGDAERWLRARRSGSEEQYVFWSGETREG